MKSHTLKTPIDAEQKVYEPEEADTIQRCPHDEENPYVTLNVNVLRDKNISPECSWLICYLLTNKEGWKINRRQVINHLQGRKGRDSTHNIFAEAMEAGYMKRVDILVKNPKGGTLRRCKYYLSETPKFKKILLHTENQEPGNQSPENKDDKVIPSPSSIISKNPPLSSPPKKAFVKKSAEKKSLRSEEEEISIFKILEDTQLSPKEKLRLTKEFSEAEVTRALTIAKTQTIKKNLMSLLLNILKNPDKWPDASEAKAQTPEQQLAYEYNEKLRKKKGLAYEPLRRIGEKHHRTTPFDTLAEQNDIDLTENNCMKLVLDGFITNVSIKSLDFAKDVKRALAQLG